MRHANMKYAAITFHGKKFLLPEDTTFDIETFNSVYAATVRDFIRASDALVSALSESYSTGREGSGEDLANIENRAKLLRSELSDFKKETGIIGFPFDMRDTDLYIADRKIDVSVEMNLGD